MRLLVNKQQKVIKTQKLHIKALAAEDEVELEAEADEYERMRILLS